MEASQIIEAVLVDPDEKRPLGQLVLKAVLAAAGAAATAFAIKKGFDAVVDRESGDEEGDADDLSALQYNG